jgi:Protein of unknown function (DUF4238)
MKEGDKHHYIPKFYLKQWALTGGKLCEFRKPREKVVDRMRDPDGTGYVRGLYTFDTHSPNEDFLERKFLLKADNDANLALEQLLALNVNLPIPLRIAWARFLMTLLHRNPENIRRIREIVINELPSLMQDPLEEYGSLRRSHDPPTFDEYRAAVPKMDTERATIMLLQGVMDSKAVGSQLCGMIWTVVRINNPREPLLTCDCPLMTTDGIGHEHGHIVLPISPYALFVAVNNQRTLDSLLEIIRRPDSVVIFNEHIVSQALDYVYAKDNSQRQFVAERFGDR